jgi:alkylated DNA repair dioxygenase AlkB
MQQSDLFAGPALPPGMQYRRDFISAAEEAELVARIVELPLSEAKYHQYTARRRTISFGAGYDFSHQRTTPAPQLPAAFHWLRARAAEWVGIDAEAFVQTLVAEYRVGTPLGWHRDVPNYEIIVGISLAGPARLRMRPYPWSPERKRDILSIDLEPRSAYILRGVARWGWQHQVPPTKALRYSITFRTARTAARIREHP